MDAVKKLPKPQMRHLLRNYIRNTFVCAGAGAVLSGFAWWWVVIRRAHAIEDRMMRDYNPDREYERMKNLGLFQHVRPADESKAYYPGW